MNNPRRGFALLAALVVAFGALSLFMRDPEPGSEEANRVMSDMNHRFSQDQASGRWHWVGTSYRGYVEVGLRADGAGVAEELNRMYGRRVRVTVGVRPYPRGVPERPCPHVPTPSATGMSARTVIDRPPRHPGDHGAGKVNVRNDSTRTMHIDTGEFLIGDVVDLRTRRSVGVHTGVMTGILNTHTVAPGGEATIGVVFGTAACEPDADYALPAGRYALVVSMVTYETDVGMQEKGTRHLVTPPVEFEIPAR